MIDHDLQINNVYTSLQEIKNNTILLTTPSKGFSNRWLQVNFHSPIDRYRELLKLQNLNIIRVLKQLGPLGNNLKNYTFQVNPNFDEIYQELAVILDDPFYAPSTRYKEFVNLLTEKASSEIIITNPLFHKFGSVSVDGANFELKINDIGFKFTSNNNQFKFIFILVKAQGNLIDYKDIYINSGIKAPNEQEFLKPEDYAEFLKHVKNNLSNSLRKKHSKDSKEYKEVEALIKNIESTEGKGYKLKPF